MITPTALQRAARREILTRAKNAAALLALVPKANIDPVGVKPWPIIMVEAPQMLPRRMACANGADVSFDVHAFAGPKKEPDGFGGEKVVQTGYDHICAIGEQIDTVLAPNNITLEDGSHCKLSFSDVRILKDVDPDHWHWFGQINCQVLKEVA